MKSHQLYAIVYEDLLLRIESKEFRPGDKLPTESQLCEHYNVGKATIRRALSMLIDKGYIYSVKRIGYFATSQVKSVYYTDLDDLKAGLDAEHQPMEAVRAEEHAWGGEAFSPGSCFRLATSYKYVNARVGFEECIISVPDGVSVEKERREMERYLMSRTQRKTLSIRVADAPVADGEPPGGAPCLTLCIRYYGDNGLIGLRNLSFQADAVSLHARSHFNS